MTSEVVLCTWNIRHCRGMDDLVDLKRTAFVLERLSPDIVALQEVDQMVERSGKVDQARELASFLGMDYRFSSFMPCQGGRYGMAILSRLPIVSCDEIRLTDGNEPRTLLIAGCQLLDGSVLHVAGVHFDWVEDDEFRLVQAKDALKAMSGISWPVVVLGDFNDEPGSRTLAEFSGRFVQGSPAKPTFPSDAPVKQIDFAMLSKDSRLRTKWSMVVEECVASDHRPVLMCGEIS
jgi:endonuclease/exonuclease/phosphatase family metal-dependent hydrolase